jgi:hypothetical protein
MINDYIKLSSATPVTEANQQDIYKHYLTSKMRTKMQFNKITDSITITQNTQNTQNNLNSSQGFLNPRKSSPVTVPVPVNQTATDMSLKLNEEPERELNPLISQRNNLENNENKLINTSVSTCNNDKDKSISLLNEAELALTLTFTETETKEN